MKMGCGARGARSFLPTRVLQSASLNRSMTCFVLRSLSNGTRLGNLPARLSTATARFGTFPHSFDIVVFSALVCTGITDVRADAAKLMRKPRISRQQGCANPTYWRALVAKADGSCHFGRIVCEALVDAC